MPVRDFVRAAALAAFAAAVPGLGLAQTGTEPAAEDVFTAVVAAPVGGTRHQTVIGTDGAEHAVYEILLTNTKHATATLQQVDVLDGERPDHVLASWSGDDLLARIRSLQPAPADSALIPFNESRLVYVELEFPPGEVPASLIHRFHLLAAPNPAPTAEASGTEYLALPMDLATTVPVLQPPLRGAGWVAANGCCNSTIVHRGSLQGVNGGFYDSQRFAIDWMRLNGDGELMHGDPAQTTSYVAYDAEVYAVADGTVVDMLDDLDDQVPGTLPDPATITMRTVDGNHVILDIGDGRYAFYAHLRKDSVPVHRGDRVAAGDVIGRLGNTGNSSAPHLHFHLMDGPSALGSQGVPYVIDAFDLTGQIDVARFDAAEGLDGKWASMPGEAVPAQDRFPLNLNIVDFGTR